MNIREFSKKNSRGAYLRGEVAKIFHEGIKMKGEEGKVAS